MFSGLRGKLNEEDPDLLVAGTLVSKYIRRFININSSHGANIHTRLNLHPKKWNMNISRLRAPTPIPYERHSFSGMFSPGLRKDMKYKILNPKKVMIANDKNNIATCIFT